MDLDESAGTFGCGIGVRETLDGDGAVRRRLLVRCDLRRESVELADCHDCERRVAVRLPTASAAGVVTCRGPAELPQVGGGAHTPVRLVMERDVACVRPEVAVDTAALLLLGRGVASAPVVDGDGHPVGVIELADVMRGRVEAAGPSRTVRDVMSPVVFAVFENTELARAAAVMSSAGLAQLPVLRGDGSLAGLLSTHGAASTKHHAP